MAGRHVAHSGQGTDMVAPSRPTSTHPSVNLPDTPPTGALHHESAVPYMDAATLSGVGPSSTILQLRSSFSSSAFSQPG